MGEAAAAGCAKGSAKVDGSVQSNRTAGAPEGGGRPLREAMRMGCEAERREVARREEVLPELPVMRIVIVGVISWRLYVGDQEDRVAGLREVVGGE